MVGAALLLAIALVDLSARIDDEALARIPRLFGAGAAGSRDMLSTIAGSVITAAGVTFSITIAALALASGQYTPRVLRTFMGDRANQVVLGTFVGVYAYCLVVLRTIRGGDEGTFIPSIAVLAGFLLALVSVGVLIFFIHHIASALQASTILDRGGTRRSGRSPNSSLIRWATAWTRRRDGTGTRSGLCRRGLTCFSATVIHRAHNACGNSMRRRNIRPGAPMSPDTAGHRTINWTAESRL